MTKKSILLLGGGGFIGKALAYHLSQNDFSVHVLCRRNLEYSAPNIMIHKGSLDDNTILEKILPHCSGVIHLASTSTPGSSANQPVWEGEQNILPSLLFLELFQHYSHIPLIFVSSGGTLYGNPPTIPVSENQLLNPFSYHGAGKIALEAFFMAYANLYKSRLVILRPSNIYGPGQSLSQGFGVIRTMLEHLRNETIMEIWGNGETIRDFLYIEDILEAINALLKSKISGIYNIGSGEGVSLNMLREKVERVCNKLLKIKYFPKRDVDVMKIALDCSNLKNALDWKPRTNLEQGIYQTWEWLNQQ